MKMQKQPYHPTFIKNLRYTNLSTISKGQHFYFFIGAHIKNHSFSHRAAHSSACTLPFSNMMNKLFILVYFSQFGEFKVWWAPMASKSKVRALWHIVYIVWTVFSYYIAMKIPLVSPFSWKQFYKPLNHIVSMSHSTVIHNVSRNPDFTCILVL